MIRVDPITGNSKLIASSSERFGFGVAVAAVVPNEIIPPEPKAALTGVFMLLLDDN